MQQANSNSKLFYLSILICFLYFISGFTALAYEVLWAKMLATIFGVSAFGVVITISAFMAGLGGGSYTASKLIQRVANPLLLLGVIEIGIAIFAFNLPTIFSSIDIQIQSYTEGTDYSTWIAVQSVVIFCVMFMPAFALGFGFPLVLKSISSLTFPVGVIYGANTIGGVFGSLFPLILLPEFGWTVSDRLIAILGIMLGVCFILISFVSVFKNSKTIEYIKPSGGQLDKFALLAYAAIGAGSIMLEIAWTRMYGMVLLRTEYVLAVILAIFLLGIGLGGFLASRAKRNYWFKIFPLIIVVSGLSSLYLFPLVSTWAETASYSSLANSMIIQGLIIGILTLPATLAFGAWLPVLVAQYSGTNDSSARLYGANSIGGAIGGLSAGFILFPLIGTNGVIVFALMLILLASLFWVKHQLYKVVPILVLLLAIPALEFPSVSELLPNTQSKSKNLSFYEDAISLTHVVEQADGQRLLLADLQRMDASSAPDAVTVQKNQARLPLLLHPEPKTVLFLGLGTGITAAGSLPYPDLQRTSVELSKGSIAAAENWFGLVNDGVVKKIEIVNDDARRYLKSTSHHYDVIVGDLFHPDMVGRSALLSLQQFNRAKDKLNQDGIFVQWIALNQFDLKTLKVVLATFKQAFPNAVLFMDGFRIGLVGFNGEFYGMNGIKQNLASLNHAERKDITGGEGLWTWLGRYWGKIPDIDSPVQDEWAPVIEFLLPQAKFNRQMDLVALLQFFVENRPTVKNAAKQLGVDDAAFDYFVRAYFASELYVQSWEAYFSGKNLESQKLLFKAYDNNPDDQWIGFGLADAMYSTLGQATAGGGLDEKSALNRILAIRSDHIGALQSLMLLEESVGNRQIAANLQEKIRKLAPLLKNKE